MSELSEKLYAEQRRRNLQTRQEYEEGERLVADLDQPGISAALYWDLFLLALGALFGIAGTLVVQVLRGTL